MEQRSGRKAECFACLTDKRTDKRVLVVSGDRETREELRRIFGAEYGTCEAENGRAALERLASGRYALVVSDLRMPERDGWSLLRAVLDDDSLRQTPVVLIADRAESESLAVERGAADVLVRPFVAKTILRRTENILGRRAADGGAAERACPAAYLDRQGRRIQAADYDCLTGVLSCHGFYGCVRGRLDTDPEGRFLIIRMDLDNFKVINDLLGSAAGDRILADVAEHLQSKLPRGSVFGRAGSDHFLIFTADDDRAAESLLDTVMAWASDYPIDFRLSFRVGVYRIGDPGLEVSKMCDRALLALRSVKRNYAARIGWYDDSLRSRLLEEQELVSDMVKGLEEGQFVLYFQPLFDYSESAALIGAEALVRWEHPDKGLLGPGKFIPLFERNGFISSLDLYVWERACAYLREWRGKGYPPLPVSVNLSRQDIYQANLCEALLGLSRKYRVPPELLRLEITESAYVDNPAQLILVVQKLRDYGFTVEMDDFGSGYSSLNMLKDVPVDILKLDMRFLEADSGQSRGGSILSSVVRMAHWLRLPVIAEGVETKQQADYLRSIGCHMLQGNYFARPMPADAFEVIVRSAGADGLAALPEAQDGGAAEFLDASAQATLLFNSFAGGALIAEYDGTNVEALRVNDRYYEVLGVSPREYEGRQLRLLDGLDPESRGAFTAALEKAAQTRKAAQCELRCLPAAQGRPGVWISARAQFLACSPGRYVFYVCVENITDRKKLMARNAELTEELAGILRDVPGGVLEYQITDHVEILRHSDRAAEMFGFGRDEYAGRFAADPLSAAHPDDLAGLRAEMGRMLSGKIPELDARCRHICKDGSWHWVRLRGHVSRREGAAAYVRVVLTDIDRQVRGEQELARQTGELEKYRRFLETLYAVIPCGILLFTRMDRKFRMLILNDAAWKIFGYQSKTQCYAAILGRDRLERICPDDRELVKAKLCRAIQDGARTEFDCRILRPDGAACWIHLIAQCTRSRRDLLMVFSDVTEQKREEVLLRCRSALLGVFDEVCELDTERNTYLVCASKAARNPADGRRYPLKAKLSARCESMAAPEDAARMRQFYTFPLESEKPCRAEFRRRGENGEIRWISETLLHTDGPVYMSCSRDITDEKAAGQDTADGRRPADAADGACAVR